ATGNFLDPDGATFIEAQKGIYLTRIHADSGFLAYAAAPLKSDSETQLLIVEMDLTRGLQMASDYRGLGQTGEVILAQHNPATDEIAFVTPLRHASTKRAFDTDHPAVANIAALLNNRPVVRETRDYRNTPVLEVARKIEN